MFVRLALEHFSTHGHGSLQYSAGLELRWYTLSVCHSVLIIVKYPDHQNIKSISRCHLFQNVARHRLWRLRGHSAHQDPPDIAKQSGSLETGKGLASEVAMNNTFHLNNLGWKWAVRFGESRCVLTDCSRVQNLLRNSSIRSQTWFKWGTEVGWNFKHRMGRICNTFWFSDSPFRTLPSMEDVCFSSPETAVHCGEREHL